MNYKTKVKCFGIGWALIILGGWWWSYGPGWSGIIAHRSLGEGREVMVTQTWMETSNDPYAVLFWYRTDPEDLWSWTVIDFGVGRWADATLDFDPDTQVLSVLHNGEDKGQYFLAEVAERSSLVGIDLFLSCSEDMQPTI